MGWDVGDTLGPTGSGEGEGEFDPRVARGACESARRAARSCLRLELASPLPRVGSRAGPRPGGGRVPWVGRCWRSRWGGEERGGRRSRRRGLVKGSATCLRRLFIPPSRESGSSRCRCYRHPCVLASPLPGAGLPVPARRASPLPTSMSGVKKQKTVGFELPAFLLPSNRAAPTLPGAVGVPPPEETRAAARRQGRWEEEEEEGKLGARLGGDSRGSPCPPVPLCPAPLGPLEVVTPGIESRSLHSMYRSRERTRD